MTCTRLPPLLALASYRWQRRTRAIVSAAILGAASGLLAPAAWAGITVSASFSPAVIAVGGVSTLTIVIDNNPPPGGTGDISFTSAYPGGLVNAASPAASASCGGTVTATAGESSLSFSGGSINGNNMCTVTVDVTSTTAGSYLYSTGTVTTTDAGSAAASTGTLTVTAPASTAPGGFNAFETATAAGSTSGVIRTKVAGAAFALDIVALNASATAVETTFIGDVRLELVDASGASCGAYALIQNLGTHSFAAAHQGRRTRASITEANVWRNVRLRMTYPASGTPTVVACSTDNFAIRPASLGSVTVTDADSVSAGVVRTLANTAINGGNVHKAGRPFTLAASALNAAGAVATNYAGSPLASPTACVLPAACTLGTLATGTWNAASGVTTTTATYSEVGAFATTLIDTSFADVDAADTSLAARTIESAAQNVGRFVPDRFELATANTPQFKTFNDTTCNTRSFTYVGQPFGYETLPQAAITAKNAAGTITQNYAGTLWKLDDAGVTQTYADGSGTLDSGLVGTPVVVATGGGTGTLTANPADVIAFVRTTPVAPFAAAISLSMSIVDSAENVVPGNGTIDTLVPALFSNIAFDAGNQIRFGRLALTNAHGSELIGLPVPIEAQFWTAGGAFARNTADACTQLAASQVELSGWQRDLAPCETSATLSGRFVAGRGNLRFGAPGANNTGSVNLVLQLGAAGSGSACVAGSATPAAGAAQTWLQGSGAGGIYNQNPSARASFGLHRGSRSLIYMREMH